MAQAGGAGSLQGRPRHLEHGGDVFYLLTPPRPSVPLFQAVTARSVQCTKSALCNAVRQKKEAMVDRHDAAQAADPGVPAQRELERKDTPTDVWTPVLRKAFQSAVRVRRRQRRRRRPALDARLHTMCVAPHVPEVLCVPKSNQASNL